MKRVHIVGRKNHGKTTLLVELVEELTARGLRVGAIKHTHHRHELDTPGKDSYRHRMAGAAVVGIRSQGLSAVFWPNGEPTGDGAVDRYAAFAPMFADCDLVLVEGDSQTEAMKIEVWRASLGTAPLAREDPSIAAIVSDDDTDSHAPPLSRSDVPALANWLLAELGRP